MLRIRINVQTPINAYKWPVPIPKDTSLELIRIEMLKLGAEYAWFDEVCLRPQGAPREDLRTDEWRLDVPTIGHVYHPIPDGGELLQGPGESFEFEDGRLG